MAKKSTTEWADILGPARKFEAAVTKTRSLYDLPLVADGAKEVALLSIFKEEQRFAFKPVMRALQRLSKITDWSPTFFVCDRVESEFFDWRKMPLRQYSSFQDFYRRELESTWGEWEQLQHTYARVVRGEISKENAQAEIEERARRAREINEKDQKNKEQSRPGKRTDLFDNNTNSDVKEVKAPTGNSEKYAHRKLREDRPDIHQRVLDGELSPHAGMIEAGFRKKRERKKRESKKRTPLDHLNKWWAQASPDQQAAFWAEHTAEMAQRAERDRAA